PVFLTRARVPGLHFLVLDPRRDLSPPGLNCAALPRGELRGGTLAREQRERRMHRTAVLSRRQRAIGCVPSPGGPPPSGRRPPAQTGMSAPGPPPKSSRMVDSSGGTVAPASSVGRSPRPPSICTLRATISVV